MRIASGFWTLKAELVFKLKVGGAKNFKTLKFFGKAT